MTKVVEENFPEEGVNLFKFPVEGNTSVTLVVRQSGYDKGKRPTCGNNTFKWVSGIFHINNKIFDKKGDQVSFRKGELVNIQVISEVCVYKLIKESG